MTVITKAITEKKTSDKMEQPLFVEENATDSKTDPEAARPKGDSAGHYFVSKRSIHRIHVTATFLLFLVALMILIIGVIGGLYIYKQYARTQMRRFRTGWYSIPYDSSNKAPYGHQGLLADSELFTQSLTRAMEQDAMDIARHLDHEINNFFKERFEIDLENERYEKIDVPDFRGGRQGRFIHDFNINKTGIIDIDGHCCFVMPLNRQRVLPPRNMYDLLRKMYNGYYEVDTAIVRETMKVVTPPITDMSVVGTYIARECQDLPIYMLKKVDPSSVVKRSVSSGVFGQFAGNSIMEVDIVNLEDFE
ncbi:Integral membrane protein 2 [Camponotus japonicus]